MGWTCRQESGTRHGACWKENRPCYLNSRQNSWYSWRYSRQDWRACRKGWRNCRRDRWWRTRHGLWTTDANGLWTKHGNGWWMGLKDKTIDFYPLIFLRRRFVTTSGVRSKPSMQYILVTSL